jgi:SanA protein
MRRRKSRAGRRITAVLAALVVLAGGFTLFCRLHVDKAREKGVRVIQDLDNIPAADYVIVPAAAIRDGVMSLHLQDRLESAIRLYKAGKADTLLLSGGYSQESKGYEAELMRAHAIKKGVIKDDIIVDNAGVNTYATLKRAKEHFGGKKALVCTQDRFAARTLYLADAVGLSCVLVGSDIQEYGPNIVQDVREYLSATKAFLDAVLNLGPAPSIEQQPYETG